MTPANIEEQLQSIQAQLAAIRAELESRNRHLAEFEELKTDLAVIVQDVMQNAIVELDEVAPFLKTGDFLNLIKKILRNTNRIADSLAKLESAADFFADARPLSHDLFNGFIHKLDELERKGYFQVGAELQTAADALVNTLASKRVLPAVTKSLEVVSALPADEADRYSLWKVYRATKTPSVRRLMGFFVAFIQALSRELDEIPDSAPG